MKEETFPDAEVTDFIVYSVLRTIIDDYIEGGKRVGVRVCLVAGKSQRDVGFLGSVGRAMQATITVKHIRNEPYLASEVECTCRVDPAHADHHPEMNWLLKGTLRRDERGLYLQDSHRTPLPA